jgi:hypothetical protein
LRQFISERFTVFYVLRLNHNHDDNVFGWEMHMKVLEASALSFEEYLCVLVTLSYPGLHAPLYFRGPG